MFCARGIGTDILSASVVPLPTTASVRRAGSKCATRRAAASARRRPRTKSKPRRTTSRAPSSSPLSAAQVIIARKGEPRPARVAVRPDLGAADAKAPVDQTGIPGQPEAPAKRGQPLRDRGPAHFSARGGVQHACHQRTSPQNGRQQNPPLLCSGRRGHHQERSDRRRPPPGGQPFNGGRNTRSDAEQYGSAGLAHVDSISKQVRIDQTAWTDRSRRDGSRDEAGSAMNVETPEQVRPHGR